MNENSSRRSNTELLPERITRGQYLVRLLLFAVMASFTKPLLDVYRSFQGVAQLAFAAIGTFYFLFLIGAFFGAILLPRLRDTGLSVWWALLLLILPIGILMLFALLFIPSDAYRKTGR